jgi:nicotinamidase/pyrazinamidase
MSGVELQPSDALIVVDVQLDFLPGGTLPVSDGDEVIPVLNRWIELADKHSAIIVATRDWHPQNHISFVDRGGPWPRHCVRDSRGADFHPTLNLPTKAFIVSKGSDAAGDAYSAFDGTHLADLLKQYRVKRVLVGGLALDVCVRATVLDALQLGFEVCLIRSATRAVDPEKTHSVLEELRRAGAVILEE